MHGEKIGAKKMPRNYEFTGWKSHIRDGIFSFFFANKKEVFDGRFNLLEKRLEGFPKKPPIYFEAGILFRVRDCLKLPDVSFSPNTSLHEIQIIYNLYEIPAPDMTHFFCMGCKSRWIGKWQRRSLFICPYCYENYSRPSEIHLYKFHQD